MSQASPTAYETFYASLSDDLLPVALQIRDVHGNTGLGAQGVPISEKAQGMIFSDDPMDRAKAAILAVEFVGRKIVESNSFISPSIR